MIILTKDNLAKRNWVGSQRCCFCDQDESIQHLFLKCPLARLLWRIIQVSFNISPTVNLATLFSSWLNEIEPKTAARIRDGVCALL